MAGGNKKKKKQAANPARGFATTSIQSKSKVDDVKDSESIGSSDVTTPETASRPEAQENGLSLTGEAKQELHELSPEELEARLETSELQQFVDKHAAKVRKEATRQVSRLQTDKRLLRGQGDFLSVKDWLPDELMQLILDYTIADRDNEHQNRQKEVLPLGDDLVAKIWNLRLVLVELDIPPSRVDEAISFILRHPPSESSLSQPWGLSDALDWLALNSEDGELLGYDAHGKRALRANEEDSDDPMSDEGDAETKNVVKKRDSPLSIAEKGGSPAEADIEVSDIESDAEPDELLSAYLRTKEKLFLINPEIDGSGSKKKGGKNESTAGKSRDDGTSAEHKLQQKLRKIQSDMLFDQREADAQWMEKKTMLNREQAQRRRLQLADNVGSNDPSGSDSPSMPASGADDVLGAAAKLAEEVHDDDDDDTDLLSGMFNALPGVSENEPQNSNQGPDCNVTVRDFGRITGMSPRRILEETCRSRDSRCKISFKQVSPTTYNCRHSVSIAWSKEQELPEASYLKVVDLRCKPRQFILTMLREATPDVAQSESYAATVALFLIFYGSPKEEKSHLRLPPAFRDLWSELVQLKQDHVEAADRETVKGLRRMIDEQAANADETDDEVIFNANSRRLNGIASGNSTPISRSLTPAPSTTDLSQDLKELWSRKAAAPSYQRMLLARMNLPMFHAKADTLDTIGRSQITVVVGDTGSGKSTQVPQFLLENELSQGRNCKIYCTEPRRISAISLAQRVSEELGEQRGELGTGRSLIGYAIRLESQTVAQTRLVYATVGIVLRMLEGKDGLNDITHLILDEVHERNIDTDFLLIILRSLIDKRPDLKIVLMSATVDAQKFSRYLYDAPIISVPGRTFPVQPRFLEDAIELTGYTSEGATSDVTVEEDDGDSDRQEQAHTAQRLTSYSKRTKETLANYDEYRIDHGLIVKLLETVAYHPEYQGFSRAILVFVPGIQEIRQLNDMLVGNPSFPNNKWRIHALHSSFTSEDQQSAFDIPPNGIRKIVIATNIAETGITIPDVTCVIDTGKHREMRFDERKQMSRLTQSFIAKANAKQRRGRAGRVQEGICFHLFTKHRFDELMAEQQTPEMLRLSLQDLVMRVRICKLGDIEHALSEALDPPSSKNIRRAIDALIDVGALTETEQLTPLGTQLAKLPLDAQLGKLILFGTVFGCLDFCLTVAAAMSSKSPFLSPMNAKKQADTVRLGFKRGDSDLLTLYNAYDSWRRICKTQGVSEYHFCNRSFLSAQNLANIEDLKGQLLTSLLDAGFVALSSSERTALMKVKPGSRQRYFVSLPEKYCKADDNDFIASSVVAWSFYPKVVKQDGKGWRNIANNQSLGLHPTSVNKGTIPPEIKFLSFYSIMQSSSKYTNAQETTPVSDFALVLLAGDAVFHMYAGVIVIDGNRLKFKVKDWKTMFVLKTLRAKLKEVLGKIFKNPGRELGDRQRRWMGVIERIFEQRNA